MTTRISIEGELDAARIESLRKTLDELAASNSDLTIDMKNCTFLDSSGVGAIVFIYKRKLARGYIVRIAEPSGQPLKLLRHLGIASLLTESTMNAA